MSELERIIKTSAFPCEFITSLTLTVDRVLNVREPHDGGDHVLMRFFYTIFYITKCTYWI